MSSQWSPHCRWLEGQVVAVPPAGDGQAEVGCGTGDPLLRIRRAEGPEEAGRGGQLEPELLGGRFETPREVPEVAGAGAEEGEVADAVGADAPQVEGVADALTVAEQLHHPGGREHAAG